VTDSLLLALGVACLLGVPNPLFGDIADMADLHVTPENTEAFSKQHRWENPPSEDALQRFGLVQQDFDHGFLRSAQLKKALHKIA
jgi:hypothetical protein